MENVAEDIKLADAVNDFWAVLRLKGTKVTCRLHGTHMAQAEARCRREGRANGPR